MTQSKDFFKSKELSPSNGLNIYVCQQDGSFSGESPESSVQKNPYEKLDKSTPPRSCSGNGELYYMRNKEAF